MGYSVNVLAGVYLEGSKYSKTRVFSTGSGTEHDPVRVQSAEMTVQEFWIRTHSGAEEKITLEHFEVDARQGHEIVLFIAEDDDGNGDCTGYMNFTTKQALLFNNTFTARMFAKNGAPCVLTMALAFVACGIAWYMEGFIAGIVAFAVGLLVSVAVRNLHAYSIKADLDRMTRELSVEVAQHYGNKYDSGQSGQSALASL